MLNSRLQVDGLRNGKTLTVFLNVLLMGDLVKSESVFENVDLFPKSAKKLKVTIGLIQSLKSSAAY